MEICHQRIPGVYVDQNIRRRQAGYMRHIQLKIRILTKKMGLQVAITVAEITFMETNISREGCYGAICKLAADK
jgi:hypothetical protein